MRYSSYTALRWFRISIALGFVLNVTFALPALFAPRFLETLTEIGTTSTVHWLQNVGILLLVVAVMYLPAMMDPFRYLFISYLVVAGRFSAGVLFLAGVLFMNYPSGMKVLTLTDLILSSIQAVLLYFMLRDGDPRAGS